MKLSTILGSAVALASSASALLLTQGVTGGSTGVRYEIRQLQQDYPQQYTLFMLAMQKWQAQPQSSPTSYYGVAGIHGVPDINYNGVGKCSSCSGADGYCTHSSILFLGWHRAYLATFEQELVKVAKQIAATYPDSTKAAYVKSAGLLRLPFWDWAAKPPSGNNIPAALTAKTLSLNTPTGMKTIPNPLYQHTFTSPAALKYSPWTHWKNTLRHPTSTAADATSNEANVITSFNNIRGSLQDQLYQIYSTCDTYSEVGLDAASTGTTKCSNSLEGIHNIIHTTMGGSKGHMTVLPLAAFDPSFWLHHSNIDRQFAMWQTIYPNSYGASQKATAKSWTVAKGSTQGANSPLTPFYKSAGTFWTTNSVRNWKVFGYTYPEFVDSDGSAASIRKYVNALYGPNASKSAGSTKRDTENGTITTPLVANNGSLFQYVANIQTTRFALDGSYNIYLFNGAPTESNPVDYILDPNLIGPLGVFSTSGMVGADAVVQGSIPLTRTLTNLVDAGTLSDLTEATVVPYLAKNLQWIIVGPDGSVVDPKTVPDFDISVYASTATMPADDELPVWSAFILLKDVTKENATVPSASASGQASVSPTAATASSKSSGSSTKSNAKSKATSVLSVLSSVTSKVKVAVTSKTSALSSASPAAQRKRHLDFHNHRA